MHRSPFAREPRRLNILRLGFALVVVVGVVVFAAKGCKGLTGADKQEATKQAKAWADELGIEYDGVRCAGTDSDGNGYVSCQFSKDGKLVQEVECAAAWGTTDGCRTPRLGLRQ